MLKLIKFVQTNKLVSVRKLQICLPETKFWWRIDSDTVRIKDNIELINKNINVSLKHHQNTIQLLKENQEKRTLQVTEIETKIVTIFQHLSTKQQSIDTLETEMTKCNDHFNRQSKSLSNF